MKICVRCRLEKPLSNFHNLKRNKDGRAPHCKACDKISRDKYNLENPDAVLASDRRWKAKNRDAATQYARKYRIENREKFLAGCRASKEKAPKKYLVLSAKMRARKKEIEFSITENDIEIPDVCPVFGTPLRACPEKRSMDSPSIDRIDNDKGYVPGNVAVISYKANMIKSIGTAEDHEAVAKWMRNINHGGRRKPSVRVSA